MTLNDSILWQVVGFQSDVWYSFPLRSFNQKKNIFELYFSVQKSFRCPCFLSPTTNFENYKNSKFLFDTLLSLHIIQTIDPNKFALFMLIKHLHCF